MSWEGWVASLRRRRTVRYFIYFAMLHASCSFDVWPIESGSMVSQKIPQNERWLGWGLRVKKTQKKKKNPKKKKK